MNGRFKLSDLPPKAQAEAISQLNPKPKPLVPMAEATPKARRLRQSQQPILNKLEAEFLDKLRKDEAAFVREHPTLAIEILSQAVRLELARGQWYKPDFFLPNGHFAKGSFGRPIAYEVKGPKAFRGGFENLKTAARVHQWIHFVLAWKNKETGEWEQQIVLP